jgi:hypothetical protein
MIKYEFNYEEIDHRDTNKGLLYSGFAQ